MKGAFEEKLSLHECHLQFSQGVHHKQHLPHHPYLEFLSVHLTTLIHYPSLGLHVEMDGNGETETLLRCD